MKRSNHHNIVALTGEDQSGKDTVGRILVESYGMKRYAFADRLYEEIAMSFGVEVEYLRDRNTKSNKQGRLAPVRSDNEAFQRRCAELKLFLDEPLTSRELTALWGTQFRRKQKGQHYWTARLLVDVESDLGGEPPTQGIVITDMREDHEALLCYHLQRRFGYHAVGLFKVSRPGASSVVIPGRSPLPDYLLDHVIDNRPGTTPCELRANVQIALRALES